MNRLVKAGIAVGAVPATVVLAERLADIMLRRHFTKQQESLDYETWLDTVEG